MKKFIALTLALLMLAALFAGCKNNSTTSPAASIDNSKIYISIISKGFQHQFWQTVKAGSEQAAKDLGVTTYFTGPEGESAVTDQVNMLNSELAKNPSAICLAALDTQTVLTQLQQAYDKKIPVIGFDSGVPNAPAGQIAATAATNQQAAAGLAAQHMFDALKDKITAATASAPITIVVLSQDVTSASIQGRTSGFAQKMLELVTPVNASVAITGGYAAINTGAAGAAVTINVVVGASADIADMTNAANGLLNTPGLAGVFMSNEGAVSGLLAAVNAGSKVPGGVVLIGFDAGAAQKAAVKSGMFLGSITQDPYQIGYQAVALAVKAIHGEAVSDVDTGAKWYDASNMANADIANLLYD